MNVNPVLAPPPVPNIQAPYNPYQNAQINTPQVYMATDRVNISSTGSVATDSNFTKLTIGGIAGYKFHQNFLSGADGAIKGALGSAMGIGALVSGTVSAVKNINAVTHGNENVSKALSNVVSDTIQGVISGAGGVATGGLAAMALKAMGIMGTTPLAIVGVIGGAVGAVVANKILNTDGLRKLING